MLESLRSSLSRMRGYIIAAAILFTIGIILGVAATIRDPDTMLQAFAQVAKELQQLGEDIYSGPVSTGIVQLFLHNLQAVGLMTVLGLALGIYPALGMLINGLIIGVVGVMSRQTVGVVPFLAGIVPHGIFEIPALIIGAGIGLRLGLGLFFSRHKGTFLRPPHTAWRGYLYELKNALKPLLLCIIMLAIAAIVEVAITPRVITFF